MRFKFLATYIIILCFFSGCSYLEKILEEEDTTVGLSAEQLYTEGKQFLNLEDFVNAIKYFEVLEARFPFGKYSTQAMLDLSYAYYASNKRDDAILEINRFIRLYPNHPEVSYAYYLRALSNFDRDANILTRFFGHDPARYDVTALKKSFNDFSIVVNRYPNSKYSEDSINRLRYIKNLIAKNELYIAEYYNKRSAHVAAVERIKYMLENYGGTPSTEQGLLLLIDSYNNLRMKSLALDSARVLRKNYPFYIIDQDEAGLVSVKVKANLIPETNNNDDEEGGWFNLDSIFDVF